MNPQCFLCERYSSQDISNMKRHQKQCQDRLYCAHCEFHTKNKATLVAHMRKHQVKEKNIFKCKNCSYASNKAFNYKRHQLSCGVRMKCAHCDFKTQKKIQLVAHLQKNHKNIKEYHCKYCSVYKTSKINDFSKHQAICKGKYVCKYCDFTTTRKEELHQHLRNKNHTSMLCDECGKIFPSKYYFSQHQSGCHPMVMNTDHYQVQETLRNQFKILKYTNFKMAHDLKKTLYLEMKEDLADQIQREANNLLGIKWYISIQVSLYKLDMNDQETWASPVFKSDTRKSFVNEDRPNLEEIFEKLNEKLEMYCNLGSGWIFDQVLGINLAIAKHNPLSGSSWLPTPKKLSHRKISDSLLNIQNKDDECCFKYSILASKLRLNDADPNIYQKYDHLLDWSGLQFPVEIRKIDVFERKNDEISISVFGFENNTIFPLRISPMLGRKHHIDLLLITNEEISHYILIKKKNSLFKHIIYPKCTNSIYICDYCMNKINSKEAFVNHVSRCKLQSPQAIKYPLLSNNTLQWKNYHTKIKKPVIIYADFETANIEGKLIPTSYAYVIVDDTHRAIKFREHRASKEVVHHFLTNVLKDVDELKKSRINHQFIQWTCEDKKKYEAATHCHICEEAFDLSITNPDDPMSRVADHYHFEFPHTIKSPHNNPGHLRGAAHRRCNAEFHHKFRVPVVFHNLKNFDGHLIIKEIGSFIKSFCPFKCIPQTIEKYSTFSLGNIDFIDSLEFLNASLDTLVSTLNKEQMKILKQFYPIEGEHSLLARKGIFPYDYIDSYEKLENTTKLPTKDRFYSKLSESNISDSDYNHASNVWNVFKCSTLGDYQDLYNKCDVLLLADVFENFRSRMLEFYGLDPANFISFPSLSWTAMLKMTKVKLELITDPDIYLMFEQGIRGGVAVVPTRYAESVPGEKAIAYVDSNNLYGKALSSYLPIGEFKHTSTDKIQQVLNTPDDSDIGYVCEVDLFVPDHLHDYMNDFPLAPTNTKISPNQLSPYQRQLVKSLNTKYVPTEKLVTTLEPKLNYILHYRNLKLYVKLGLVVTKVHRIVQFKQAAWMKPYIDFNTKKRAEAASKFDQNLLKLASNACFGRSLMNVKKHKNFTLVTNESKAQTYINKTTFKQFSIFNENLVGILYNKTVITLNKPIYAGMVTLEISKLIMYDYYYNILKPKYGENMKLCMTDTDSLLLLLGTSDLYADFLSMIDTLDTSNYPPNHYLYSEKWKKIAGKFKDESPADPIQRFVGLRAKMYTFETESSAHKCIGKGIPRQNIKTMNFSDYKNVLFNETVSHVNYNHISTDAHTMEVKSMKKVALSPMDDKRYILPDKVNTLAFGHYRIKELESENKLIT